MRSLMNCIAYSVERTTSASSRKSLTMSSSDIDSYSSGSDFTDVSSLSSNEARDLLDLPNDVASTDLTHDCANLRHSNGVTTRLQLGEKNQDGNKKSTVPEFNTTTAGKNRIYGRPPRGRGVRGGHTRTSGRTGDQEDRDLRLLSAALSALEASQNSNKRVCRSPSVPPAPPRTPNHSFAPDQVREITRENLSLLGRLHRERTRPVRLQTVQYSGPREASSAINRRQLQRQIQRDNLIILRKITAARGVGRARPSGLRVQTY